MGPNQSYKFLHNKGNHKQNEKATQRMGENLQRKQPTRDSCPKYTNSSCSFMLKNNPIKKAGRRVKYIFLQRRRTEGQKAHEKMLTNY